MNRVTIRRFDAIRTANVVAVLYAIIALVVGLLVFLPLLLIAGIAGVSRSAPEMGGLVGAGIVGGVVFAGFGVVFYGVLGWITTALVCALYNLVAGRIGGIRVEVAVEGPYGGPGYPAGYGAPGTATPAWPVAGSPGGPTVPPPGWGQPG